MKYDYQYIANQLNKQNSTNEFTKERVKTEILELCYGGTSKQEQISLKSMYEKCIKGENMKTKYQLGQRFLDLQRGGVWVIVHMKVNNFKRVEYELVNFTNKGKISCVELVIDRNLREMVWGTPVGQQVTYYPYVPYSMPVLQQNIKEKGNIKLKGKKIFKDEKVTILRVGDKKFISKNTDEKYDLEKGVMMALLLSEGYNYQDIKQLIERSRPISEIGKKD